MWMQKLLNSNQSGFDAAKMGWSYAIKVDINFELKGEIKTTKTTYSEDSKIAILEPPFEWKPYFIPRSEIN